MAKKFIALLFLTFAVFFVFFQSQSVFGGDGGDLVSAICTGGIAHPQGYALYSFLGRILFIFLPFFTPAWRVSLLSSLPAAATVTLVFLLIYKILNMEHATWNMKHEKEKKILAGLIGASSLAFSYLFWLYASVPEVFSLNNLFFVILLFLTIDIILFHPSQARSHEKMASLARNGFKRKLYLFSFVAGLSISHHYFTLWFCPVFALVIWWYNRHDLGKIISWSRLGVMCFMFLLGLLPLLYIPLAARTYPLVSWDNAVNLTNFWHLVTRQSYGGFINYPQAIETGLSLRLLLIINGLILIPHYFGEPWTLFIVAGLIYLLKFAKKIFFLFSLVIGAELIFLFNSGFPLVNTNDLFTQGTYSRFLLPEIIIGGILLGLGVFWICQKLTNLTRFNSTRFLFTLCLLVIPLSLLFRNLPKIYALRTDFTAENFGRDLLSTVSPKGMLVLTADTQVFNAEYVNFCLKERPDIRMLLTSTPAKAYKKYFPDLILPAKEENIVSLETIQLNASSSAIFMSSPSVIAGKQLVPIGLLYAYFPGTKRLSVDEVITLNNKIWAQYHYPYAGILKWFQPAVLANVLDFYNLGANQVGQYLVDNQKYAEAKIYLQKALIYNPKDISSQLDLAFVLSEEKKCAEAEKQLLEIVGENKTLSDPYLYLAENARDCFGDKTKEAKFRATYQEIEAASAKSLKQLLGK